MCTRSSKRAKILPRSDVDTEDSEGYFLCFVCGRVLRLSNSAFWVKDRNEELRAYCPGHDAGDVRIALKRIAYE